MSSRLIHRKSPFQNYSHNLSICSILSTSSTWLTTVNRRFDSSVDRAPFVVQIGVGRVIRGILPRYPIKITLKSTVIDSLLGWDEGVIQMKVGEKATLDITP